MRKPDQGWRKWGVAGAIALPILAIVVWLFGAPPRATITPPKEVRPLPPLVLARTTDDLFNDEATYRDPTPLFLPSRWNATEDIVRTRIQRDQAGSYQGFPAKFAFGAEALALSFPPPVEAPQRASDAFKSDAPARPMAGFGQKDQPVPELSPRGGFVEILRAGDGRRIFAETLVKATPPGDGAWQPLEFLVAVGVQGIVHPSVLLESSRDPAVDSYFKDYIANVLRVGERLRPGFYRVCVGP